jgi:plastocyanin
MKRLLLAAACLVAYAGSSLSAAPVSGKISFLTKRGQRPNAAETLVWLEPLSAKPPAAKPPQATFQMVTRGKTFLPHILPVPSGSTVSFPNQDPIAHNIFSLSSGNAFDLGFYRNGPGKAQKFNEPGVVNVYCNVHPNMSAVVHVMPTPYYVFADASGAYSLDVPPGKYRLVAWNEQGGSAESTVEVTASGVTGTPSVTIDGRTFRFREHTNKFGKPYQAPKEY